MVPARCLLKLNLVKGLVVPREYHPRGILKLVAALLADRDAHDALLVDVDRKGRLAGGAFGVERLGHFVQPFELAVGVFRRAN